MAEIRRTSPSLISEDVPPSVRMAVFPGRRLKDWEPYWHGAFEYQYQKDFDHLFEALRKAGLSD